MIKSHCFNKDWIDGFRQKTEFAVLNPPVCEKMIFALQLGIKAMNSFLMHGNFTTDHANDAAAKAALLSVLIKNPEIHTIVKFSPSNVEKANIQHPEWNFLNRLKKLLDQSPFFYWNQTIEHIFPLV